MATMVKSASRRELAIIRTVSFFAPLVTLVAPRMTVTTALILAVASVLITINHGQSLKELLRFDLPPFILMARRDLSALFPFL